MGQLYDITIIGAGPNGLFASYTLCKQYPDSQILCLDRGTIVQSLRYYPDIIWHSPMRDLKLPSEQNSMIDDEFIPTTSYLVDYYVYFYREHNLNYHLHQEVIDIQQIHSISDCLYRLFVRDRYSQSIHIYTTKSVIVCTGIYDNPRRLEINTDFPFCTYGFDVYEKNKRLVVVGGGYSSLDFIRYLLPYNKVFWIIRGGKYFSDKIKYMDEYDSVICKFLYNLTIHYHTTIAEIKENRTIILSNGTHLHAIDQCSILIGYHGRNALLDIMNIQYKNDHPIVDPTTCMTNLPNVYIFGALYKQSEGRNETFLENGNETILQQIISTMKYNKII